MRQSYVQLHLGSVGANEPYELATSHALLRQASRGDLKETIRVYQPLVPTVVFGRRDVRLPGLGAAVRAATAAGFDVAVRVVGGRVVAYTEQALVIDHVKPQSDAAVGMESRFIDNADRLATLLGRLGVDARVGAVPGEYCPGAHSVSARGVAKLVGTAQRVVPRAWLFSSLIILSDHERLAAVLQEVHKCLGLAFDPDSVGSVGGETPGIAIRDVEELLLASYPASTQVPISPKTTALAAGLLSQHQVWGDTGERDSATAAAMRRCSRRGRSWTSDGSTS